jgi:hypothetical protein
LYLQPEPFRLLLPINIGALIHSARSAVEPEERYLQYEAIARMAENIGTLVDAAYEQTWDAFRNDTPAWTTVFSTYEQFEQNFFSLKQRAEASAKSRNYLDEARRSLHNAGIAGEDWTQIVPPGEVSATQVRAAARCGNQFSKGGINPNEAIRAINHIIIVRLRKAGRGGTRIRAVTSSDYQKASSLTADEVRNCEPFSDHDLEGLGLVRLSNGLAPEARMRQLSFELCLPLPSKAWPPRRATSGFDLCLAVHASIEMIV